MGLVGLTGKYDFKGIKKWGARGLSLALSSTGWGAWLVQTPVVRTLVDTFLEQIVNWLANNGLVVLNIGAISVEGDFDQKAFDSAMEEAFNKIVALDGKMTPEQMKAIDDEVLKAARKFLRITNHN